MSNDRSPSRLLHRSKCKRTHFKHSQPRFLSATPSRYTNRLPSFFPSYFSPTSSTCCFYQLQFFFPSTLQFFTTFEFLIFFPKSKSVVYVEEEEEEKRVEESTRKYIRSRWENSDRWTRSFEGLSAYRLVVNYHLLENVVSSEIFFVRVIILRTRSNFCLSVYTSVLVY